MPLLDQIREEKLTDLAKACFDPPPTVAEQKVLRDSACFLDAEMPAANAPRPIIRSDFVRWLATDPEAANHIDPKGLRVYGITLSDKLDLQSCRVLVPLHIQHCAIKSEIDLCSAETKSIRFLDSSFEGIIRADRIKVDGPLFLRGSIFSGEIRLVGAQIKGALDCLGAKLTVKGENALSADRAEVGGMLNLGQGKDLSGNPQIFESNGTVRLLGAKIAGDLNCSGAKLTVKGENALYADNAEIEGNVFLYKGFESTATVRLPEAKIKGMLSCSGAKLRVKEGNALYADGAEIGGSVLLNVSEGPMSTQREEFESTGTIRLLGAKIKGILSCSGAKLNGAVTDSLFADCATVGANVFLDKGFESSGAIRLLGARIDGELGFIGAKTTRVICKDLHLKGDMWWTGVEESQEAILDLTGASVKSLHDDQESWPSPGHLTLDGLSYEELTLHERPSQEQVMGNAPGPELPFKVEARIEWLMLQAPERRIKPEPWMQLAKLLEAKGDREGAKHVIFKYRILLAKEKEFHPFRWLFKLPFRLATFRCMWPYFRHPNRSWAIAFAWLEEAPLRICWSIAATLVVGTLIFAGAFNSGAMLASVQIQPNAVLPNGYSKNLSAHYPPFQPFLYTLENAVPLVKLGMDEKWMPDPKHKPQLWFPRFRWLDWLRWFNSYWFLVASRVLLICLGWFQAGVLGAVLLKRFKE
ncbi:MAG TPA: hypothetical protein VME86_12650 [Acidobacteriaceae bacterium]|nr:hypothetical protein [Acidobacteriaceae bacterium]